MTAAKKAVKKTTAKKAVVKKEATPKKETFKFDFWKLSSDIETIAYKIDSVKNVIELVAEDTIDNPKSGAMWAAAEMLDVYIQKLEKISMDVMEAHRESGGVKNNWENLWR